MARDMAPGLLRDSFAFMHLNEFSPADWEQMRTQAQAAIQPRPRGRIIATDMDPQAIDAARDNARQADVENDIEFSVCDFRQTPVPEGKGTVIFNPEYGERLGHESELGETYQAMGDFLKKQCAGYRAGVFTANAALAKRIGLRSERKVPFYSAKLACTLHVFDLWEGPRTRGGRSQD